MDQTRLSHLKLKNFTVFDELDLPLSPGVNVFVGENGTGKTHLLKLLYATMEAVRENASLSAKLFDVFPLHGGIGALFAHGNNELNTAIQVKTDNGPGLSMKINRTTEVISTGRSGNWDDIRIESTYIPVKEMLAHAPGFISTTERRELSFETIYTDILKRAYLPKLKGKPDAVRRELLQSLQEHMNGSVAIKGERFYLCANHGDIEFSMVAEGLRKLALLWLLIQNGSLGRGSILFWDEPEANLNPKLIKVVVDTLLKLCREGVQIFIATHSYFIMKEFDISHNAKDSLMYHSLYKNEDGSVSVSSSPDYRTMNPNVISDVFADMYDRDLQSGIERINKHAK